ncbi:MAG: FimV/HubP family polar landmark protein [Acidiferrobacterales bacterium]
MSRPGRLFAIAATMLFMPGIAHALGLGNLTVYSALNEPLKAEIRFTSLSEKEFRTLDVRLIRQPQQFDGSGLESAAPLLGIGITLVERRRGLYSLLLQSAQPIREPFVRLILEIDWAGGRLVRELITLIDPRELRAPIEEGMPEFPSVAKVGDLGRRDSEASSRADSKSAQTALTDKPHKSTPNTEQAEVLTEKNASAPQPETPSAQESTVETTVSELDVSTIPTPESLPPTPSARVPIETQRRLIQAEIENWAKQHGLSVDKEPRESVVSDVDVETLPHDDIATKTLEVNVDRPIPNEAPEAASLSTQTSNGGLLGRDLLMVFIGLVVALILVAGGVLIRIYVRRHRALSHHAQRDDEVEFEVASQIEHVSDDDVENLLEYGDRRSGHGRRRQFIPVEVERRQEPRRQQDRFAPVLDPVATARANTMDETEVYMACGHDENAELLLKEALAKNPGRQDLKVKLLAIYQHRDDPKAFDSLAKELYSNVYPKRTGDDDIGSTSEKHVDEDLTTKHAETVSDFDLSIEFDTSDSKSAEAKNDDAMGIDSLDSPDGKQKVDAKIFEHEIDALAMTISTNLDAGALHSELTPANENLNDATMEDLQVNDFADIKQVVDRGVDLLEADKGSDQDDTDQPQSTNAATDKPPRKSGKRSGNKNSKSTKSSIPEGGEQEDMPSSQWKEPSTKIDLAKAYIAMGDAERARSILDEVLDEWDSRDGTQG